MALAVLALAVGAAPPAAGGAQPGVKVLVGFEWEEYAGRLPRFWYLGRPHLGPVPPGWKGEKIERVQDVGEEGFQVIDGAPDAPRARLSVGH